MYKWKTKDPEEIGLRRFILDIRRAVDMLDVVHIPNEYKAITREVHTPFLRDTKERVAASLVKDPPIYTIEPRDESIIARQAADMGGRWDTAMVADMQKLNPGHDFIHTSALNLVGDSESVIKVVHRPDAWANFPMRDPDEPAKDFNERTRKARKGGVSNPFAARVVDRLQMVFGDGEYGDEWCIEYGMYPVPYLNSRYGHLSTEIAPVTQLGGTPQPEEFGTSGVFNNFPGSYGGNTLKLEYFDARQWAVVINGKMAPGFPKENPYAPFIPYFRTVSLPTLYALRFLVPALNELLTMKMNWAYLSAYPIPVIEALASADQMLQSLPVGDTGEPSPDAISKWKPGKEHFLPPGYTMRFLEPPKTGGDIDRMIDYIREMIDISGVPSVMRGVGGARQPGYAINQLMAASQLTYRQLGQGLSRQQEMICEFLHHNVRHTIDSEVYILASGGDERRWLGLRPTGRLTAELAPVDMLGPSKVTFRPILPTDEQSNAMIAIQLTNPAHPLISDYTALKDHLQKDDPDAELDRIVVQQELAAEPLRARMLAEAMRQAGIPLAAPSTATPPMREDEAATPLPNDQTNGGEPTMPGLTQPATPNQPITPGGRPAGAFPGQPGG